MAAKKSQSPVTPIVRTSAGLRDAIFDELDAIRAGTSNPTRANAVAKLATSIVETVHMEVEVQRHLRQHPVASEVTQQASPALGLPMPLGSAAA